MAIGGLMQAAGFAPCDPLGYFSNIEWAELKSVFAF